jgi:O-antigen ligase
VFIVVAVIVLTLLLTPKSVQERWGITEAGTTYGDDLAASSRDASTQRRLSYQVLGMRTFVDQPLTGVGLGGFGIAYDRSEFRWLSEQNRNGTRSRVAHNMFLEVLVGTGLLGTLPLFGVFYLTCRDYVRARMGAPRDGFLSLASQGLLIGFAAYLVSSSFLSTQYEKYLWLLVALAPISARLVKDRGTQELFPYADEYLSSPL